MLTLWLAAAAGVCLGLVAWGLAAWATGGWSLRGGRPHRRGARLGPMPGYAAYPGEAVDAERLGLGALGLVPVALEVFHSPARARVVLSARWGEGAPGVDPLGRLGLAARRVSEATGAEVAVVEVAEGVDAPSVEGRGAALFARDGGGWSGAGVEAGLALEGPHQG
jgi:hypothetical protein